MARRAAGTGALVAMVLVGGAGSPLARASSDVEVAIVGGESTEPGEYPATGALVRGYSYRCTATLIAPDVAVTAAHCLEEGGYGDFGFTLDEDLTATIDDVIPVLVHHQHPDFHLDGEYAQISKRNDIAVVILEQPVEDVPVERLDERQDLASLRAGDQLSLCGYGREVWSAGSTAGIKRDATVYVAGMSDFELQSADEDPQPCRGDSGGPLFVEREEGRRMTGLVSRSVGATNRCATGAIYTRVEPYIEWIESAAVDRDVGGCSAAGETGPGWLALFGWLALARRRRR
jgi:uncharacterized protein (TIGR03382 family)